MGIKFLKNNNVSAFVRPNGYSFPTGINTSGSPTLSVDYLIVAGGGAGVTGGGGAGGLQTGTGTSLTAGSTYPVVIGAGGTLTPAYSNGNNSSFNNPAIPASIGGGQGGVGQYGDGAAGTTGSFTGIATS